MEILAKIVCVLDFKAKLQKLAKNTHKNIVIR